MAEKLPAAEPWDAYDREHVLRLQLELDLEALRTAVRRYFAAMLEWLVRPCLDSAEERSEAEKAIRALVPDTDPEGDPT